MKAGQVINGYRILRDFSTAGGGLSKWSFAEKHGEEFFIKEFLSPTYPDGKAPGSEATKADKRKRCSIFEAHHNKLWREISPACADGGNLIATKDFFRFGSKYYKVTEKVDVSGLTPSKIASLEEEQKLLILKTVCHSLGVMHNLGIVHGDLKPDNILIKQTLPGKYTAKLIDFDNSYFAGSPPLLIEEVVGDMVYYSPELALYVQGSDSVAPKDLHLKSDIFALALIFHQYVNGIIPAYDMSKYNYCHQVVLSGERLRLSAGPEFLTTLLDDMLQVDPNRRPTVKEVFERLKSASKEKPESSGHSTGRLKIKMIERHSDRPVERKEEKVTGRLKISMGTKKGLEGD